MATARNAATAPSNPPPTGRRTITATRHNTDPLPLDRKAPSLRLVPPRPDRAARAPFALLLTALLGGGLTVLLLLNATAAQTSFELRELQKKTADLTLREQELQRDVTTMQAPGELASQAEKLGMVRSNGAGFIVLNSDGSHRVVGDPQPAAAPPPPPAPKPNPTTPAPTSPKPPSSNPAQPTSKPTPAPPAYVHNGPSNVDGPIGQPASNVPTRPGENR